ncbi:MAG TPA: hypothetical protein VMZ04_02750, partial [Anaerolineae bacterium]|nr:hypothetical protein [Anaerolineae bacterium]
TIESREGSMLSSHAVKRFYTSFSWYRIWRFMRCPNITVSECVRPTCWNDSMKKSSGGRG